MTRLPLCDENAKFRRGHMGFLEQSDSKYMIGVTLDPAKRDELRERIASRTPRPERSYWPET